MRQLHRNTTMLHSASRHVVNWYEFAVLMNYYRWEYGCDAQRRNLSFRRQPQPDQQCAGRQQGQHTQPKKALFPWSSTTATNSILANPAVGIAAVSNSDQVIEEYNLKSA